MKKNCLKFGLILGLTLPLLSQQGFAQTSSETLLGDFGQDWKTNWVERKLTGKETQFEVEAEDDSNLVLRASSKESGSALWRMLQVHQGRVGKISWRWKIDNPLYDDIDERSKRGDDYVARLYVVFEPHLINWKSRALCYVWATTAPVGATYSSPYSNNLQIIVVESGKEKKREWVKEERNYAADYAKAFGRQPEMMTAVAVMVDTDNSAQQARTWFDDIVIEYSTPADEAHKQPAVKMGN